MCLCVAIEQQLTAEPRKRRGGRRVLKVSGYFPHTSYRMGAREKERKKRVRRRERERRRKGS